MLPTFSSHEELQVVRKLARVVVDLEAYGVVVEGYRQILGVAGQKDTAYLLLSGLLYARWAGMIGFYCQFQVVTVIRV